MSIATLKKKSQQTYKCLSAGKNQFSINGTTRNQGYVGQSNVMRRFPMTPYSGNVAKGNGGCCGTYVQKNIISGINYQNDSGIIKSSVVGTGGMISKKYRWIRRPELLSEAKKMKFDRNENYIEKLKKNTLRCIELDDLPNKKSIIKYPCPFSKASYLNSRKESNCNIVKNQVKKTQNDYLITLNKKC